jgi:hypothetical protein
MTRSRLDIFAGNTTKVGWASLSSARLFFKRQLWIWPLLAAIMLGGVGYFVKRAVDQSLKENLGNQLQVVLNADVAALQEWFHAQEELAQAAARDNDVVAATIALIEFARTESSPLALVKSQQRTDVQVALDPWIEAGKFAGIQVINEQGIRVGTSFEQLTGTIVEGHYREVVDRALRGETLVTRPFRASILLPDEHGKERMGLPTMQVCTPLYAKDQKEIVGVLAFRLRPEKEFTEVLQLARLGHSGETYAFDKHGVILSQSRFDQQLKDIGLLPASDDASSALNLELRDPGVDMTRSERPSQARSAQPLIYPVAEAIKGSSGVNMDGPRDYRGVPEVDAWTWLPKYGFGVITAVDYNEAMAPRRILDIAFWSLYALLAVLSLAIFVFSLVVARMQQRMQKAALKQQKLGQYHLEEKLGQGGMGVVYRASHALLRRPTAIKLLDIVKTNEASIARFEREVQLTSQLNHPNTIAIYDYGHTPEGIFYYAMEYLDGLDLERLVARYGPLTEGRAIHLLLQVCGSLSEAHALGLVHRDIKPANIVVSQRGGVADFVKVLDFGLVKALDSERARTLTVADSITGTPMYIAPEGIEKPSEVDARSDLYAIGAVGYYLLTGSQPYDAANVVELCMKVVNSAPEPLGTRVKQPVSPEMEAVLMRCLEKLKQDRFASVDELAAALRACPGYGTWTPAESKHWWQAHTERIAGLSSSPTPHGDLQTRTAIWATE